MTQKVPIKKTDPRAKLPTYGSEGAAGADLYALLDEAVTLMPGQTCLIPTGIAAAIPAGTVGLVFARSGLASKRGLAPANKVGVIDSDYRGQIMVALHNHGTETATVEPFERIAQLVILPFITADFVLSETLDETERGAGGFGSTGQK